jgi:hypothetical protein
VNITQARRKILISLVDAGGTIQGAKLGSIGRASASIMQGAGLVEWEQPVSARGQRDLGLWLLHITNAGRAATVERNPPPVRSLKDGWHPTNASRDPHGANE